MKTRKIENTIMKHTCRPTKLAMEKAMQIQAIVFQFKRPRATTYAPIVGINDRGDIMWSGTRYWLRSYLCGPKRQRCDIAHGSMEVKSKYLYIQCHSLRGGGGVVVWAHRISLTPPLFIEVPVLYRYAFVLCGSFHNNSICTKSCYRSVVEYISQYNFQQFFSYIVAVSFIGGGNRSTRRKPLTCRKSLTNFYHIMLYRVQLATSRICTHNIRRDRR